MKNSKQNKRHNGECQYEIDGIEVISSTNAGPTIGIMAVTHGDEPAGLSAIEFLHEFFITNKLEKGRIILIKGNLDAANVGRICKDENLNRLFVDDDMLTPRQRDSSEYQRSRILMPILESLDFLLDIHSTNNPGPLFSIVKIQTEEHIYLSKRLPVEFYSYGWGSTIIGTTCDWVDSHGGVGITIECGDHKNPAGGEVAINATKYFIQTLGAYDFHENIPEVRKGLSVLYSENVVNKETFEYSRAYKNFELLKENEIIAKDETKNYIAPNTKDSVIIFPTNIDSIRLGAIKEAYLVGKFQ